MGGLQAKSMTSQRYGAVTRWRICVTMATLWQQQDGGYALLWKRYDNNKVVAMRYYGNVMTTTRWWLCVTILHLQQYSHRLNLFFFSSHFAQFFIEWEMFEMKIVYKIQTHFVIKFFFFRKSCLLWENVGKYCRAGQATDGNTEHAYWLLNNWGCRHTLRISNTYSFSTIKMVMRTRFNFTFIRTLTDVSYISLKMALTKFFLSLWV